MFRDIPIIRFGTTDGRKADVFINDRPAGAIRRYGGRPGPTTTTV